MRRQWAHRGLQWDYLRKHPECRQWDRGLNLFRGSDYKGNPEDLPLIRTPDFPPPAVEVLPSAWAVSLVYPDLLEHSLTVVQAEFLPELLHPVPRPYQYPLWGACRDKTRGE